MGSVTGTLTRTIHSLEEMLISWATPVRGTSTTTDTRAGIAPFVALVTGQCATIRVQQR